MALNLSDYLKMLTEPSYRPKARLTFLRMEDESPYDIITGDILDGNIQITRSNGVRRSCSLTLKNDDGKYIPNPYNIWVNRKFFLELGLEKETYVDQTVWENDPDGAETKEAGRFDNTVTELQDGTLTNVFVDGNGLQLVANEPTGNRISPNVSLSEIKNVDSSLIEWVATTPQGTVGEEVLTQSQFEQGTLTDVSYDTDGIKLNLPTTEGNWLSPTLDLSSIKKAISSSISWEADEQEQTFDYTEDSTSDFATGTMTDVAVGAEGLEFAQANKALSFDGVDDYVNIGTQLDGSFPDNAVTVEVWWKGTLVPDISHAIIGRYYSPISPFGIMVRYVSQTNTIRVNYSVRLNFRHIDIPESQFNFGEYYHSAITYKQGEIDACFINGTLIGDMRGNLDSIPTGYNLNIGDNDTNTAPFNGLIDEVRIWNYARTQTEIQADMNKRLTGNEPGLVGYWRFDEGSGTTAIDSSGNGNDGTIIGATYTEDVPFEYYAPTGNRLTALSLDTIKDVTGSSVNWTSTNPSTNNSINETEISTGIFDQTEYNLGEISLQYDISEYFPTGTRTSPNIDLSAIKNATTTSISWTSIEPAGTSIVVEVSRDGGSWVEVTNGGSIPVITAGEDLTGSYLQTRLTLSTSDTSITPQLSSLDVVVNGELNTEVNVEARFVGDSTWVPLTNGQPIPFINSGDDLTGKTLEFRQILNTEDISITPVLTNFTISIDSIAGVRVFTKLDTDPDWIEVENGSAIPGVSFGSDLDGRTLQVKTELNTVDTSYTPTLKWINYGVDWNTSISVETQLNGSGWKTAVSGEPIPDILDNDDLTGKTLQVRATLESGNREVSPRLKTLFYKVFERGRYVTYKVPIYETFYLPQGVFVLRNPQITSENSYSTINISGIDKFSLLDGQLGGNLESTYIIDVGSNINTAIRSILSKTIDENAQFPIDAKVPILQNLASPIDITPYTIRKELGGKFADILLELNGMVSRNMYYNPLGHFVFEEDFDDAIKGSVWDFTQDEFLYLGSTHEYKFEDLYNKVIVVSDNVDGGLYVATATNTNPASKTNINAIGVKIAEPIVDNVIYTQDLAQIRANYELKRLNAMQSAISLRSVPMFHLDVDKVITLTDDRLGLNQERFLLQDINIPLGFGQEMTVSAVKTIDLALD